MSHYPERKQKDCLNCGAVVYGKYCHLCGQENVEPKESFWHLVTHFVYDVTHFDGKFFSSVKYLLFRPGFLSHEYIRGKRMTYLNPIRMYVFISAFFFIFFFSVVKPGIDLGSDDKTPKNYITAKRKIENSIENLQEALKEKDTPDFAKNAAQDRLHQLQQDLERLKHDTTKLNELNYYSKEGSNLTYSRYKDVKYYDSVQAALPVEKRDGFVARLFERKGLELKQESGNGNKEVIEKLLEKFFHSFPQVLFVSLPLFALLLQLLYVRKKNYYYADHVIYTVHLYCATFLLMFIVFSIGKLEDYQYTKWVSNLTVPVVLFMIWYQYKSMRNFYEQGRGKTILKYLLLLIMSCVLMVTLFTAFFLLSFFTV